MIETPGQVQGGSPRVKGRRPRRRGPLGEAELAALQAKALASDARVKDLIRRERVWTVEWADEMREVARDRLHELHGYPDLVSYARARGVDRSASDLKQLVKLVERLDHLSAMRAAFESGECEPTKLREVAREAERRGGSLEVQAELLEDARRFSSRELERRYQRARGEPEESRRWVEVRGEADALLQQVIGALRVADPTVTESQAIGLACSAFLAGRATVGGAGAGTAGATGAAGALPAAARLVLHLAVPAGVQTTPGATKAQAALENAAAAVATVAETRDGQVPISRARLEQELCNAEIHDVRHGPSRITRTVPPRTARYVHDRDHGRCKVRGCSNLGFLHVHHEPGRWVVGHDPDKMLLLCSQHHAMRHEGLLGIEPVAGGFAFSFADGSPAVFVPLDRGVPVSPAVNGDGAPAGSEAKPDATPASGAPGAATTWRDEEGDAIKALVKLEMKKTEARELVRLAKESLASRGAPIDACALAHEALRLMPLPGARRSA